MKTLVSDCDNPLTSVSTPQKIVIETTDSTKISGTYYPLVNCSAAVLICSAIGISQKLYVDFARWLNKEGFAVLTFDYRGTGESLFGEHIKNSLAKQHDWGQQDMAAALNFLAQTHPGIPLQIIAHGNARTLMGLMPNYALISGAVSIGAPALYLSRAKGITWLLAALFLRLYIPVCLSCLGYVPLKWLGWDEDIPAGVAKQWKRWSLSPGYICSSFGGDIKKQFYREFHAPILVMNECQKSANASSIEDMSDLYRNARVESKKIDPKVNFFKNEQTELWTIVVDWLKSPDRQTIKTAPVKAPGSETPVGLSPAPPRQRRTSGAYTGVRIAAMQTVFIGKKEKVRTS